MPKRVSDGNNNQRCMKKICNNDRKPGIILKMVLRNFMCHSLLEVKFEENVNFVVGRNGSGKSAILTALIVCLGAKATGISRGKNIKNFIKAGTSSASIQITLCNEGEKAYKPEIYGRAIIIERIIQSNGSSMLKIKAASGKIVSKQAKDIRIVTRALRLQIDNPLCIFNEDAWNKNFLCSSSSDPKTNFTLFYKATRLEEMYQLYKDGVSNLKETSEEFDKKTEAMQQLHGHIKELEMKLQQHEHVQALNADIFAMKVELLWANVARTENEHHKQEESVGNTRSELETLLTPQSGSQEEVLREEINEELRSVNELKENIETATSKLSRLTSETENLDDLLLQIQNKYEIYNRMNSFLSKTSPSIIELKKHIKQNQQEYENAKNHLENRITDCFHSFLKRRSFKGHMAINFNEATLELVVMPPQSGDTRTSLSDGERSFANFAFFYSLWQCMQFPFYFIDEFDAFMDPVNRTLVMQMLVEHAKRNKDTQFVFLTTQDVPFIKDSEVALHRLDDPERT